MVAEPATNAAIAPDVIQAIHTQVQTLTPEQQQQVLDFAEFLAQKNLSQPAQKSIWEKIDERIAQIPPEEREKMPTDGSYQHDHYLYGTPKREL